MVCSLQGLLSCAQPPAVPVCRKRTDDSAADFKKFSTTMGASFPLVHDAAHRAAGAFNPVTMPASYLIDRKGDVRHIHTGFKGAKTEQEYTKEIEALLGESL
jgi:peroxiredoxin